MLAAQGGRLDDGPAGGAGPGCRSRPRDGYVESIDALAVGLASLDLGAGRHRKEDTVDPAAGLVIEAPVGAGVAAGDPLVDRARPLGRARRRGRSLACSRRGGCVAHEVAATAHVLARVDKTWPGLD